jgi:hypothetical protein
MARTYGQLFAILKKLGLDYKDIVAEFTNGRTESLSSLSDGEYKELLLRMQRYNKYDPNEPANRKRRKIIAIARQMRWVKPSPNSNNDLVADMKRIDDWCIKYGKFHKKLNDHTVDELNILVTIFEKSLLSYLSSLHH